MTFISPVVPQSLRALPIICGAALAGIGNAIDKIFPIIHPYFIASTGVYHFTLGTNKISQAINDPHVKDTVAKTSSAAAAAISPSKYYQKIHGLFTTATGCCSLVDAMHHFGFINLGTVANLIATVGSVCFLYANVTSLEENIRVYEEIRKIEENGPPDKHITWQKRSAISGMLSNIGYILATAIMLLGVSTALALVIGVISAFCGGIKILHDFFLWQEAG